MANLTVDPEQQDEEIDAYKQELDSLPTTEPDRAVPSSFRREPVYKTPGNEASAPPGQDKKKKSPDREDLNQAEETAGDTEANAGQHENQVGSGYRHDGLESLAHAKPTVRGALNFAKTNRGKLYLGGAAAGFITLAIIAFIAILPLKILHIVNDLESRFTSSATSAMTSETDALFSNYVRKYILPGHRKCGAVINNTCNPIPTSTNPVTRLFNGWQNARLEDKIAKDYGLEFSYNRYSGKYFMKTPYSTNDIDMNDFVDGSGKDMTLDEYLAKKAPGLQTATRAEIRQSVKDATSGETLWKRTYMRYRMRNFLAEKYGIPKCIFFCNGKDKLRDSIKDQKNGAKLVINRLVLSPRDEQLGIVMDCMLKGCDPTIEKSAPCAEGVDCELGGAPESETDTKLRTTLGDLAAKYGVEDTASLEKLYAQVAKDGVTQVSIEKVLAKFMDQDVASASAENTIKALSVVGWILLANQIANVVNAINNSPATIKKLDYAVNAAASVNLYSTYRVYADEVKTGNVTAAEVGAMTSSLGPIASTAGLKDAKGGTAGAEQAPLYNDLINNGSPTASADYKCNDGSSPKATDTATATCPEEDLDGANNKFIDELHTAFNSKDSPLYFVTQAAAAWSGIIKYSGLGYLINGVNWAFNTVVSTVSGAVTKVTCVKVFGVYILDPGGFCEVRDAIKDGAQYIGKAMVEYLVPNPFSNNMSGGRTFTLMAQGADVSGNDYAHNGLGGKQLTPQQVTDNYNQQQQEQLREYSSKPLLSRLFDSNSDYSVTTKVAMAMPANWASAQASVASFFSNPFTNLGHGFASIFSLNHAFAAASPQTDPFGIVQYGYPTDDPDLKAANKDPETYWAQNCADGTKTQNWNNDAATHLDPNTQQAVNTTTNPCLLIQATIVAAGALFDSSLLSTDDLGGTSGATDSTNTPTGQAGTTIDMNHIHDSSTSVACAAGTNDAGTQDGYYSGNKVQIRICAIPGLPSSGEESNGGYGVSGANGLAVVNSRVSGAVLAMVQAAAKDGVNLAANSSFRTMAHQQALWDADPDPNRVARPGTSNHQMGLAIDFSTLPSTAGPIPGNAFWDWLAKNAASFGYKNYPAEAWHWSPTGN